MSKNAWMDETVMNLWIDKVLQPYLETCPKSIVPILFLDSYRCHMMGSIVDKIQKLGCEIEHIPGGCTYLCQPVDVGVNKPFKKRIRYLWESWMIQEGLLHGTTTPPTRKNIAQWTLEAKKELPIYYVQNTWRKTNYSWF
jgi:hypothetical protein